MIYTIFYHMTATVRDLSDTVRNCPPQSTVFYQCRNNYRAILVEGCLFLWITGVELVSAEPQVYSRYKAPHIIPPMLV